MCLCNLLLELCFRKHFYSNELSESIINQLHHYITSIMFEQLNLFESWYPSIKREQKIINLLSKKIYDSINNNNIKVLKINGYCTEYIVQNIAYYIIKKIVLLSSEIKFELLNIEIDKILYKKQTFTDGEIENFKNVFTKFNNDIVIPINTTDIINKELLTLKLVGLIEKVIESINCDEILQVIMNDYNLKKQQKDQTLNLRKDFYGISP